MYFKIFKNFIPKFKIKWQNVILNYLKILFPILK